MMPVFTYKHFTELTTTELYAILRLRNEVFVVEQNCPYIDTDNKDLHSWHLMGRQDDQLVAYSRILPSGISYKNPSIGRVATALQYRKKGLGKILMKKAIEKCKQQFSCNEITIGAQLYLKIFYESFGFVQSGNIYLEDGIEQIEMELIEK